MKVPTSTVIPKRENSSAQTPNPPNQQEEEVLQTEPHAQQIRSDDKDTVLAASSLDPQLFVIAEQVKKFLEESADTTERKDDV